MANLEYVRVSADGTQIIVRDDTGREFALPMDDRLAAALIPRTSPLAGPGALTPREIQARIRAGADVAGLAAQTGTSQDASWRLRYRFFRSEHTLRRRTGTSQERIMAFAVPILQERAHIAVRARSTLVRRASGVGSLDDIIVGRLQPLGVTLLETHWDARRLDDGRWEVRLSYDTKEGGRVATWLFDAKAVVVSPIDDEAHWLMGEPPPAPVRVRESATRPTLPVFKTLESPEDAPRDNVLPMKRRDTEPVRVVDEPQDLETHDIEPAATDPVEPPKPNTGKGRRPIPSWDEILFGAPTDDD